VSESDDPTLGTLPSLYGFDNFPVRESPLSVLAKRTKRLLANKAGPESGNLQTTMIIQLLENVLERIESLLGLPPDLCLGTREPVDDGLFGREGMLTLAEMMIRREDTGWPEDGKGGVRSLRRDMDKAKELLRSRIAPP